MHLHDHEFLVGDWRVQPTSNAIVRDGTCTRLEPKAMQVLLSLAMQPGQVVPKEEIMRAVWPDTFVADQVLTHAIWQLRKALGNGGGRSEIIETISKRGYRLVAPVGEPPTITEPKQLTTSVAPKGGTGRWQDRRMAIWLSCAAAVLLLAGFAGVWSHERGRPQVRTVNPEAYQSYMKANFEIERYDDRAAAERALALYRAATEKDPEFAAAFAGMGAAYLQMMLYTAQPGVHLRQAENAARHAIDLQPDLADGYVVLGRIRGMYQWDWKGAEEAFRRGVELNPTNIFARNYYVSYLTMMGEFDKAIEFGRASMELEPYSRSTATILAQAYLYSGRTAETLQLTERILKIDPSFNVMHRFRALALLNSDPAAAMEEAKHLTVPDAAYALAIQASIAGCAGDRPRALELRRELYAMGTTQYLRRVRMAQVEVCLGNHQQALDWLEKGVADHEVDMMTIYTAPWFIPLRGDPRYRAILKQMNFPALPRA